MRAAEHKRNIFVALVAALILLAQTALSGWGSGAMAATPMLDAFGNPLCITSTDPTGGSTSDHSKMPNCCTFGCSTVSPLLAIPDSDGTGLARPLIVSDVLFSIGKGVVLPSPDHDPGSPRAPPLTA